MTLLLLVEPLNWFTGCSKTTYQVVLLYLNVTEATIVECCRVFFKKKTKIKIAASRIVYDHVTLLWDGTTLNTAHSLPDLLRTYACTLFMENT